MSEFDSLGFVVKSHYVNMGNYNFDFVNVTMRDVVSDCLNKSFFTYTCNDCAAKGKPCTHHNKLSCKSVFCPYCQKQKLSKEKKKFQNFLKGEFHKPRFGTLSIKNIKDLDHEKVLDYNNLTGRLFAYLRKINLKEQTGFNKKTGKPIFKVVKDKEGKPIKKYADLKYLIVNEVTYSKRTGFNLHSHIITSQYVDVKNDGKKYWNKIVGYNATFKMEGMKDKHRAYSYVCKYLTKSVKLQADLSNYEALKINEVYYHAFKGVRRYRYGGFKLEKLKSKLICDYCLGENITIHMTEKALPDDLFGIGKVRKRLSLGSVKDLINFREGVMFQFERRETLDVAERLFQRENEKKLTNHYAWLNEQLEGEI